MTSKEAYNYLLGLLESGGDMRWSLVKESMDKFKELIDQQSILEEYNVTPENIREVLLTGQMFRNQPTLEECIKEWEDRGYECLKGSHIISLFHKEKDIEIAIYLEDKSYCKAEKNGTDYEWITFEEHQLLTKTLKALEVEKKND